MNTQKGFAPILLILAGLVVIGGGVYFYRQNNLEDVAEDTQAFVMGGIWKFGEVSKEPNVNGITHPVWEYTLSIDTTDETKGTLSIDGYQTLVRLNVAVEKLNDSANIIFDSYATDNIGEIYKQGDVLITVSPESNKNLMSIYWYKMQPNLEESKTEAIFVKQEEVINTTRENKKGATSLSDEIFIKAVADPQAKVLVRGDLNSDGYEDAIVQVISCGVSCSVDLEAVLNNMNNSASVVALIDSGWNSGGTIKS
jgi:hypothetical protein